MMSTNYDRLGDLARVAAQFGAHLRVNVYQPSKTDRFTLTYEQFWSGFRRLLATTRLVATTESVLAAVRPAGVKVLVLDGRSFVPPEWLAERVHIVRTDTRSPPLIA
jgi:hypothetical protein